MTIPSVTANPTPYEEVSGSTVNTVSVDIGTPGSDAALLLAVFYEGPTSSWTVSTVTYAGNSLTQKAAPVTGQSNEIEWWALALDGLSLSGANDLVVTFSASPQDIILTTVVLQNVDQTSIVGNTQSSTGSFTTGAQDATHSFTTGTANSLILTAAIGDRGGTTGAMSAYSSDTLVSAAHLDAGETGNAARGFSSAVVRQDAASATSYTTGINFSPTIGDDYLLFSVEVLSSAGGASTILPLINAYYG